MTVRPINLLLGVGETFLSKEQVAQVRTIMDDLRLQAREMDSDSGP